MKSYDDLSIDDKSMYLHDLEQVLMYECGCPPENLRDNSTECFRCIECKINALKKDLNIK